MTWQSLLREADRLLNDGHYEKALAKYYEGKKLKPQNHQFTVGIKRCHDAISADIDIGIGALKQRKGGGFVSPLRMAKRAPVDEVKSDVQHMTRLHETKEFLNTLAEESGVLHGRNNIGIKKIVRKEDNYLQQRAVFWRQLCHLQNASERLKQIAPTHTSTDYLYKLMSNVATELRQEKYSTALRRCLQHRKAMRGQSDLLLIATFLGFLGAAYVGLKQADKAVECYREELHVARISGDETLLSKALEHLAETHNTMTNFSRALPMWKERLKFSHTAEEASWIYHQITQCYLGMDDPKKAVTSAEKARGFSLEADEPFWQVNVDVLLGQAQVLLGDLGAASETLERALEIARLQDYNESIATISRNLKIANDYIVLKLKKEREKDSRPFSLPNP